MGRLYAHSILHDVGVGGNIDTTSIPIKTLQQANPYGLAASNRLKRKLENYIKLLK